MPEYPIPFTNGSVIPSYTVNSTDGNVCIRADFAWQDWEFVYEIGALDTAGFDDGEVTLGSSCTFLEISGRKGYQNTSWAMGFRFQLDNGCWSVAAIQFSLFLPLINSTGMVLYNQSTFGLDLFATPIETSYYCDKNVSVSLNTSGTVGLGEMQMVMRGSMQMEAFMSAENRGNFSAATWQCGNSNTQAETYLEGIVIAAVLAVLIVLVIGFYVVGRACAKGNQYQYDQM